MKSKITIIGLPLNLSELDETSLRAKIDDKIIDEITKSDLIICSKRIISCIDSFNFIKSKKIYLYQKPLVTKLYQKISKNTSKRIVILAIGDPNTYGIAASIYKFDPDFIAKFEITVYPEISSIQYAYAKMKWSFSETTVISLHGRPIESIRPKLNSDKKLLIIPSDKTTLVKLINILTPYAKPETEINILENLSTKHEKVIKFKLANFKQKQNLKLSNLYLIAIDLHIKQSFISPGLADNNFINDGMLTKREMRSIILNRLLEYRSGCLWDIGAGSGSISIEWLFNCEHKALIFESDTKRAKNIEKNLKFFGQTNFEIITKDVNSQIAKFKSFDKPSAIFIGGGLSQKIIDAAKKSLAFDRSIIIISFVSLEAYQIVLADYLNKSSSVTDKIFKKELYSFNLQKAITSSNKESAVTWYDQKHQKGLYILTKNYD